MNFPFARVQGWEEGVTSSSSSYISLDSSDSEDAEEEEGQEAVNQLMLNRRRNQVIPAVEP